MLRLVVGSFTKQTSFWQKSWPGRFKVQLLLKLSVYFHFRSAKCCPVAPLLLFSLLFLKIGSATAPSRPCHYNGIPLCPPPLERVQLVQRVCTCCGISLATSLSSQGTHSCPVKERSLKNWVLNQAREFSVTFHESINFGSGVSPKREIKIAIGAREGAFLLKSFKTRVSICCHIQKNLICDFSCMQEVWSALHLYQAGYRSDSQHRIYFFISFI